jgi:hypothetical protein
VNPDLDQVTLTIALASFLSPDAALTELVKRMAHRKPAIGENRRHVDAPGVVMEYAPLAHLGSDVVGIGKRFFFTA